MGSNIVLSGVLWGCLWRFAFNQIPQIPIQIGKNGHGAVGSLVWFPDELDAGGHHMMVVTPEVIGLQEKEDTAAALVADERFLDRKSVV